MQARQNHMEASIFPTIISQYISKSMQIMGIYGYIFVLTFLLRGEKKKGWGNIKYCVRNAAIFFTGAMYFDCRFSV